MSFSFVSYSSPKGHDCSIRLWNLDSKTCVQEITSHRKKFDESIFDVAFHPSKPYIASGGADALAKVFIWGRSQASRSCDLHHLGEDGISLSLGICKWALSTSPPHGRKTVGFWQYLNTAVGKEAIFVCLLYKQYINLWLRKEGGCWGLFEEMTQQWHRSWTLVKKIYWQYKYEEQSQQISGAWL